MEITYNMSGVAAELKEKIAECSRMVLKNGFYPEQRQFWEGRRTGLVTAMRVIKANEKEVNLVTNK